MKLKTSIKENCIWEYNEFSDYYETICGHSFCFSYSKKEPEFKFCPYCGKKIKLGEIMNSI